MARARLPSLGVNSFQPGMQVACPVAPYSHVADLAEEAPAEALKRPLATASIHIYSVSTRR